jgi:glycosyltransferase involved in cell wall biosynthesis
MKVYNKITNVYKNQGIRGLLEKTIVTIRRNTSKTLKFKKKFTEQQKVLHEELDFVSNGLFSITQEDIKESKKTVQDSSLPQISSANWFIPNFNHLKFGGIYTIFRFMEKFSEEGVTNRIIIYDKPDFDTSKLEREINENFPKLKDFEIIVFDHSKQEANDLPECDIAICTFWVSAYILLKFNKTKRKYYFIQDYEPVFYAGGSTSALAESTYRFGFRGLVNTPGLLAAVNKRHGVEGISFVPAVDEKLYTPDFKKTNKRIKIFFYARPHNPRNAFNLGVLIMKQLNEKYGNKIELVTAGADWDESEYGLDGRVTNLGLLKSLKEVATLYRSCDIGFVYMLSKHPSYQPFEFMASGMATVTNSNEDNLWFLRNGENCLVSEPSPSAMVEAISALVDNNNLRNKVAKNGYKSLGYTWDQQTQMIWNDIINN